MTKTNDELYLDLLNEWFDLSQPITRVQSSEQALRDEEDKKRKSRRHLVRYLVETYRNGEDIVAAKLAYTAPAIESDADIIARTMTAVNKQIAASLSVAATPTLLPTLVPSPKGGAA